MKRTSLLTPIRVMPDAARASALSASNVTIPVGIPVSAPIWRTRSMAASCSAGDGGPAAVRMNVRRSLGPTRIASTPGTAQMARRFAMPVGLSIWTTTTVWSSAWA